MFMLVLISGVVSAITLISPADDTINNILEQSFLFNVNEESPEFWSYYDDFTGGFKDGNITIITESGSGNGCRYYNNRMESHSMAGVEHCRINITDAVPSDTGYIEVNFTFTRVNDNNDQTHLIGISNEGLTSDDGVWLSSLNNISYEVHLDSARVVFRECINDVCSNIDYTGASLSETNYGRFILNTTEVTFMYDDNSDFSSPTGVFDKDVSVTLSEFTYINLLGDEDTNNGHEYYLDDLSIYAKIETSPETSPINSSTADTCSLYTNETGSWNIEEIKTTGLNINSTLNISHTFSDDGTYLWNIGCNLTNGTTYFADDNWTLTLDTTSPIINADDDFTNNRKLVVNGTLIGWINFSDDREIYSINLTWGNGTALFGDTNMGVTEYRYNISSNPDSTVRNNVTARVCDSHTLNSIKKIETSTKDGSIDYIMKKSFFIFPSEWIKIYPKDIINYNAPATSKLKDRYTFTFNKKIKTLEYESFIVEASHKIDITKNQLYSAHLIVSAIGDNGYWIDFENDETTRYEINRINDYKVEVKVYGLKKSKIDFNSIGELNCVEETFTFNNLNPSLGYDGFVLSNNNNTFSLNLTVDNDYVTSQNATLIYNTTSYFGGTINNYSITDVYSPNITDSVLVPFYWNMYFNGINYNTSTYYQNVSDFNLDNCSLYSTVSHNFTVYDELNGSEMPVDITGTFHYTYNDISKTYSLSQTGVSQVKMCISPSYASFTGNFSVFYQSADYPQRRYYDYNAAYSNITRGVPLYVLDIAEGIYGRFVVVDNSNNAISGVTITMSISDGDIIEKEVTDTSGLATFWLNPDTDYTFVFSKTGYTSVTETLRVTTGDPYTVILGGGKSGEAEIPLGTGVTYSFSPTSDLNNDTAYDFRFVMTSTYRDITGCTLYLINDGSILSSSSTSYTTSLCDITINYNTGSYDTIVSKVVYELNGSSINVSRQYSIWDRYEGQFSFKNFLDDLTNFGEAGFDDFSRMMIAFIVIFVVVAGMAFKFADFRDPEMLLVVTISLVWFFSFIGWMTISYEGIPSDWLKKYILAIIISIAGGATILKRVTD
jgi:hypothetical protein